MNSKNSHEKNNQENEKRHIETRKKNLMIASYRQKYSEKSLDKLKRIIKDENPEKIMIIKFIKEKKLPRLIDGSMGFGEKKKFIEFLRKEKKEKAFRFTKELIEMIEDFEISYEIHLRRSDDVASAIIHEFINMSVDHVILHTPKNDSLGRAIEGSISKKVKKALKDYKVTRLD